MQNGTFRNSIYNQLSFNDLQMHFHGNDFAAGFRIKQHESDTIKQETDGQLKWF